MFRRLALTAILTAALGACATVSNPDAAPGEHVSVNAQYFPPSLLLDLPQPSRSFQRVLIIAPEGARRCSAAVFGGGPLRRGAPDAERRVLLDFPERGSVRVQCDTEHGVVDREFGQVVVHSVRAGPDDRYQAAVDYYPPMIHVGGVDAEAPTRWARLHDELCGEGSSAELALICSEASFAALRRADIGE